MFRADAKKRYWAVYVSESCAGERLRLAGYRPARAWVRAYRAAERGGSNAAVCVRLMGVVCFLLERFALDHACLFSFVRKRETACGRLRFYSAVGRDRLTAFSSAVRLSDLSGSLRACAFLYGDPDEATERRGDAENGVGGAALVRFCVNLLALR